MNGGSSFIHGPLFHNVVLADEINRTPPKTQAALLEAMQEHQVTVGQNRHLLPDPFFVLATQNPIEQEGTYPLPEAQQDRFMFKVFVEYPTFAEERQIAKQTTGLQSDEIEAVLSAEEILELQRIVRQVPVTDHVVDYALALVRQTRVGRGRRARVRQRLAQLGSRSPRRAVPAPGRQGPGPAAWTHVRVDGRHSVAGGTRAAAPHCDELFGGK